VELVGAIDIDKSLVEKDIGEVAGVGRKLGVKISDQAEATPLRFLNVAPKPAPLCIANYTPITVRGQELALSGRLPTCPRKAMLHNKKGCDQLD